MKIGLSIYGSLEVVTGGNVFDRILVSQMRAHGDDVQVISVGPGYSVSRLADNVRALPRDFEVLVQDELTHLSHLVPNARSRNFPIVSIVHNLHSAEPRPRWQNALYAPFESIYLHSVDACIYNSRATLDSVRNGLGINKPFIIASPGGDRLGASRPEDISFRARQPGPLHLVFVANVTPLKGLRTLLEALELLDPSRFDLDIVGSCDAEPKYCRAMQERASRLPGRIVFHGNLDGAALTAVLRRAQVMVIPSHYEGFGIAYLEGMAFGLPAVGTLAGAIPEMISHGVNGFLIPPGDAGRLAAHLLALESDRGLLDRMALAAYQYFTTRPTWAQSCELVRDFLLGALRGGASQVSERRG